MVEVRQASTERSVRGIDETGSPLGTEEPGARVREHDWSEERRERKREGERIYLAMCTSSISETEVGSRTAIYKKPFAGKLR